MSDPLATTVQTLDSVRLAAHPLRVRSEADVRSASGGKADKDMKKAADELQAKKLDVQLLRGIKQLKPFCADAEVLKRMEGKKGEDVLLSSSTASLEVRHAAPRLLATLQEMYDRVPATCDQWPVSPQKLVAAAYGKAMLGGGVQYSLGRLIQYGPKVGVAPPKPFEASEVVPALIATGRRIPAPERVPVAITEADVKVNADSDNGFPVGGTMRDPFAQSKVLELAGRIKNKLLSGRFTVAQGVEVLKTTAPELVACKGKVKTDVYSLEKAAARSLRFYNVVGRQNVLLMQAGTQPLAEAWKEESKGDWTTGIGKGFAHGRADELVAWLDQRLETEQVAWSHTGDDTLVVRRWEEKGQLWVEIFSLDCSSFDLTQHHDVTKWVHEMIGRQLVAVDECAGELWKSFARERIVTLVGSLAVKTRHWGASGMPLQSEVNDTLMECLLRRLAKRSWHGKEQLRAEIAEVGAEVGFQIRLEDHFMATYKADEQPVRSLLQRRPFLYLGYYLYMDEETERIAACLDIPRFFAGGAYLSGGYVEKAAVGPKVALALAGYTLSFGVPPPFFRESWEVLQSRAVAALQQVGDRLTDGEIEAEVARHVYAGLPRIADLKGLVAAVSKDPREIWMGVMAPPVEVPLGAWADEPWVKEASTLFDFSDPKANELAVATTAVAGRVPPTPARVLKEREQKAQRRQEAEAEKQAGPVRAKRKGKAGGGKADDQADASEEEEDEPPDEDSDEPEPEEAKVSYAEKDEWQEFQEWRAQRRAEDEARVRPRGRGRHREDDE